MRTVSCCVAGVAVFTVALAGTAQACNKPTLSISKTQAKAGESVGFSISGTDDGAGYSITVNGRVVASGSDKTASAGISGSFQMPDVGSESRPAVPVHATVEHFDPQGGPGTWTSTESIAYVAPAPAATQPAPRPERPAGERGERSPSGARRAEDPKRAARPERAGGAPPPARTPAAAPPQTSAGQSEPAAVEVASTASDQSAAAEADASRQRGAAAGTERGGPRTAERPRPARAPELPAMLDRVPAPARTGNSDLPLWLISLLALGLFAGAAGAAVVVRRVWRRGGGPAATPTAVWVPPAVDRDVRIRSALLEAELQEMIAEERARQATREQDPVCAGRGSAEDI